MKEHGKKEKKKGGQRKIKRTSINNIIFIYLFFYLPYLFFLFPQYGYHLAAEVIQELTIAHG